MKNFLIQGASLLYQKRIKHFQSDKGSAVKQKLQSLYPLKNAEKLYEDYQIKKLSTVLGVILAGILLTFCVYLSSRLDGRLLKDGRLVRNEWGGGDYTVTLEARTEDANGSISFTVKERQLSPEERADLLVELESLLPQIIKNNNQDLDHVTEDLTLVSFLPGYPFTLTWMSENTKRISNDGLVNREGISGQWEEVKLTAIVSDQGERHELHFKLRILPIELREETVFYQRLEKLLQDMDQEGKSRLVLSLPDSLEGKEIVWKEIQEDVSPFLLILTLLAAFLVSGGMDNDLARKQKRRNDSLQLIYPQFVSRLRLYLTAGLSVRNALIIMAEDYKLRKEKREKYLQQELIIACNQFQNGVSEGKVYENFGLRCGENHYRRLGFLLTVHLKQGNERLLTLLEQEEKEAQAERRNRARRVGEEAGTKLLLPMLLMLLVVMCMILMPAYLEF